MTQEKVNWFTKHVDTIIVLSTLFGGVFWMNGKFDDIEKRFDVIEKDLVVIKTVMIMKGIMPESLVHETLVGE